MPKNVVDEIEYLVNSYGIKEISIFDDTFSEDPNHALAICKEIIGRNIDIVWRTAVGLRLNTINEELLGFFKRSGCYQLSFGIESFSDTILNKTKKPISKSRIIDTIKMVKKYGIETMGYFILGLPDDTEDSIVETIRFARKSDLDFLSFTHAVPLPGTKIFNQKYANMNLSMINWNDFNFYTNRPFNISKVQTKKIKKYYLMAYVSSYIQPKRLRKILLKAIFLKNSKIYKIASFCYSVIKNIF
jgi:radical SAM superfamily enzyme YgiQ (UPF0313 family)